MGWRRQERPEEGESFNFQHPEQRCRPPGERGILEIRRPSSFIDWNIANWAIEKCNKKVKKEYFIYTPLKLCLSNERCQRLMGPSRVKRRSAQAAFTTDISGRVAFSDSDASTMSKLRSDPWEAARAFRDDVLEASGVGVRIDGGQ